MRVLAALVTLTILWVSSGWAQSSYTIRNESISAGGTTGSSANFRATTLMAEPVGSEGTSELYGIVVIIPETDDDSPPTSVDELPGRMAQMALFACYPNPFNPVTAIPYSLSRTSFVTIRVYDVRGRLVRTLVEGIRNPGVVHESTWDGTDDRGASVESGVYFCRMTTQDYARSRKMLLLK